MKEEKDYIRDIAEIRSMMERSSKFLSLSGWAGVMAGIYALAGAYLAHKLYYFAPGSAVASVPGLFGVIMLAMGVLVLAVSTAIYLSSRKAGKRNESLWNKTSRRLMYDMLLPLVTGGLLLLIMVSKGFIGLLAPFSLIFYGLSLFNAGRYTFSEIRALGLLQVVLGLLGAFFINWGLLLWAVGFGALHIIYGIYIYFKYER